MSNVVNPNQNWNIVSAGQPVQNAPQKVLLIGQQIAGATATAGEIVEQIGNQGQEDTLFGKRSMLATMCRAFKRYNKLSRLDALPLDDPATGPVQATATFTFSGTATSAATLRVAIQSEREYIFEVGVANNASAETAANDLESVINANDFILITSVKTASEVLELQAVHAGTDGNSLKIRIIDSVPGIDIAVTPFNGGAGAVSDIDFPTVIGDRRYQTIVIPSSYTTNLIALKDYLGSVLNASNRVKDGVGFTVYSAIGTADAETLAKTTLASKNMVILSNQIVSTPVQKGGYLVEYDNTAASYFAATRALRLTLGANIAQYLTGPAISNTVGGPSRAVLPYHQTPFIDLPRIVKSQGWSEADQVTLLNAGVSFFGNNNADTAVTVGDIVTTDQSGDRSYKYLNAVDTISQVREYFFNNCQQRYAQTVLTDGGLSGPNPIANKQSIQAFLGGLYQELAAQGLCQAGDVSAKYFNDNLVVDDNVATGTVNIAAKVLLDGQLRNLDGTVQFAFNI